MNKSSSWVRCSVGPIGIDLGARFIRMAQLVEHHGRFDMAACAERIIPLGLWNTPDYERFLRHAVNEMLTGGEFTGRDVVSALGWSDLWIRNLRIPVVPAGEIDELVHTTAIERFGLEPDQVEIQYVKAGDVRQGTDIQQEVIVFGADRAAIKSHIDMLADLGLQPVVIDVGACAVFRPFARYLQRQEDVNRVHIYLDLGYESARIVVSRGAELIFLKSIPIAGCRFDQAVSENLDLAPEDAARIRGRLIRRYIAESEGVDDQLPSDETVGENLRRAIIESIRPLAEQLGQEIGLCLRYCAATFRGLRYDCVNVVGGEACNSDILRLLSDRVGYPFHIGRPAQCVGWNHENGGTYRRTGLPEWATALGLAMKPVYEMLEVA